MQWAAGRKRCELVTGGLVNWEEEQGTRDSRRPTRAFGDSTVQKFSGDPSIRREQWLVRPRPLSRRAPGSAGRTEASGLLPAEKGYLRRRLANFAGSMSRSWRERIYCSSRAETEARRVMPGSQVVGPLPSPRPAVIHPVAPGGPPATVRRPPECAP